MNVANEMSTSSILQQTNDSLYPQNHQNLPNIQNMQNVAQGQIYMNSAQYNGSNQYTNSVPMFQASGQQCQYQQQSMTSGVVTNNSTGIHLQPMPMQTDTNGDTTGAGAPAWVVHLLTGLNTRLQHIETQLVNQNGKWQSIDNTLQNQNQRINQIEQKLTDYNTMKQDLTKLQNTVYDIGKEVNGVNTKMEDYDRSIEHYSALCDDITTENTNRGEIVAEMREQIDKLQRNQDKLFHKQQSNEDRITDLQCRSMRDNLIFTDIDVPELNYGETEDVEMTLDKFLYDVMKTTEKIAFHRVHRLGTASDTYYQPRHIIAKFEHFKDRESIRLKAPTMLRNTKFGVREQFPKDIESRRKKLYPEMKLAKQDEKNRVRLVRDKLYINNVQYIPTDSDDSDTETLQGQRKQNESDKGARPKTYKVNRSQKPEYNEYKTYSNMPGKSSNYFKS